MKAHRITITLDPEHSAFLDWMQERKREKEGFAPKLSQLIRGLLNQWIGQWEKELPEQPWKDHSKCSFSTGICGSVTAGQGELDDNGYFEFPCTACAKKAKED